MELFLHGIKYNNEAHTKKLNYLVVNYMLPIQADLVIKSSVPFNTEINEEFCLIVSTMNNYNYIIVPENVLIRNRR